MADFMGRVRSFRLTAASDRLLDSTSIPIKNPAIKSGFFYDKIRRLITYTEEAIFFSVFHHLRKEGCWVFDIHSTYFAVCECSL